jgi:hypothetical protein
MLFRSSHEKLQFYLKDFDFTFAVLGLKRKEFYFAVRVNAFKFY